MELCGRRSTMPGQSTHDLLEFLDFTASKHLMKPATARALKGACNAVLSVLDEAEAADVFAVDLDGVFQRYENMKGMEVSPNTMRSYRQRVSQAIAEFGRYRANPSQWRPAGGQRNASVSKRSQKSNPVTRDNAGAEGQADTVIQRTESADDITHQFPLRRNTIVEISGIPFDVTRSEMARMTAFLSNLVAPPEETDPVQLMLNPADSEAV